MRWILLCMLAFATSAATAQDRIITKDGDSIIAKVIAAGSRNITYKRFDNPEGPEYIINKKDVYRIRYENGSVIEFLETSSPQRGPGHHPPPHVVKERKNIKYAPNVIAFSPVTGTESGQGIAITYERMLDKAGIVSLYLPVILTFEIDNFNNDLFAPSPFLFNPTSNSDAMFYFSPGLKFYPGSHNSIAQYSVGPSMVVASGTQTNYDNSNGYTYTRSSHVMLGVIVNNGININASRHLYIGGDIGVGATFINKIGGTSRGEQGLLQIGIRAGYRF